MTEAQLTLMIRKRLEKEPGIYVRKIHGGRYSAGIPDLLGCKHGFFFALEVKLPGKEHTLTKLQQSNLETIEAADGVGVVVTSVREALEAVEGLGE